MATILPISSLPSPDLIDHVSACLHHGGVITFPTESFYALGASVTHVSGVSRVHRIKGRPKGKPLLVLIGDRNALDGLVSSLPSVANALMDRFWPGPLTLILPAAPGLPGEITAGTGTIGVRQPGNRLLLSLLSLVGPLTGTSANHSGQSPPCTAQAVQEMVGDDVDLILDGGSTAGGLPSTLLSLGEEIRILRDGPVSRKDIQTVLSEFEVTLTD